MKSVKQQLAENPVVRAVTGGKKASAIFSASEAEEYKETLLSALEDDFDALDKYLIERQRLFDREDFDDREVWAMTEKEIGTLTKVLLKGARHSPAMATTVRAIVDSADYIQVGTIMYPRIKRTVEILRATRRPPKRRGQQ